MPTTLSAGEEAQLAQTIEMFEVITQSQPQDYQSLEILKEAYSKLGRDNDVVSTSKRIAEAYVQMGQLSSAILEYETILQRFPHDTEVQEAYPKRYRFHVLVVVVPVAKNFFNFFLCLVFLAKFQILRAGMPQKPKLQQ